MKFSTVDTWINENSWNPLDLIYFDKILPNVKEGFPAFIFRWEYIKTITKMPWLDFFNYSPEEQEEKVRIFSAFLSSIKTPLQIFIHSKKIDTTKYLKETLEQVRKSPYLNEKIKLEIIRGLPKTLKYIQKDNSATPYKKEYYVITSSKIRFTSDWIQEDKENEQGSKEYKVWQSKNYSDLQIKVFMDEFNRYYSEIMWYLINIKDNDSKIEPLNTEEKIIWLFAELNNGIDKNSIPTIKNFL